MVATVKVDTSEMERALREFGESSRQRIEVAAQRAVLRTARVLMAEERAEMERVFDRPTRWTLNAFRVRLGGKDLRIALYSDKTNPDRQTGLRWQSAPGSTITAELLVREPRADNYLNTQIGGGQRRQKAFEVALQAVGVLPAGWMAVPGQRAKLDAFGNHSPGEIRQILTWFDAAEQVAGSTQNMGFAGREKRRRGTRKKAGWEYFAVRPGDRRSFVRASGATGSHAMQPGIYRRTHYALGSRIEPVMIFVPSAAYKPRFDFYGLGQRVAADNFPRLFREAFDSGG
ncbi:hypothetical protein [Thauera butanivorans]|uniref:hypothetical protein n=1 Tax=Thauera butanivorans TaxID=86174 RepID=UPI000837FD69|nr:hypothetical protein [Thauera butanivorans]